VTTRESWEASSESQGDRASEILIDPPLTCVHAGYETREGVSGAACNTRGRREPKMKTDFLKKASSAINRLIYGQLELYMFGDATAPGTIQDERGWSDTNYPELAMTFVNHRLGLGSVITVEIEGMAKEYNGCGVKKKQIKPEWR